MPETIIKLENISKSYSQGDSVIPVIENLNVTIQEGKFIAVIGPSGSGKSTLLNVIGLIDTVDSGDIHFFNQNLKDISDTEQNLIRRDKLGFVYQSNNLFSDFTAIENVTIPQILLGTSKKNAYESAFKCLDVLGLSARINHLPKDLSGGEQQRVAIARAIINEPKVIIADAPTGTLAKNTSKDVFEHLIDFVSPQKISLLMATHNLPLPRHSAHPITLLQLPILYTFPPTHNHP